MGFKDTVQDTWLGFITTVQAASPNWSVYPYFASVFEVFKLNSNLMKYSNFISYEQQGSSSEISIYKLTGRNTKTETEHHN